MNYKTYGINFQDQSRPVQDQSRPVEAKKPTQNSDVRLESKINYPSRLVYPPSEGNVEMTNEEVLNTETPNPTPHEFDYSYEDVDNDTSVLRPEDDQYTFVALLE